MVQQEKKRKERYRERGGGKGNARPTLIFRPIQRCNITRGGHSHACCVTRPRVLQARHVADFRAGELACEYKTPYIGSQKGMGGRHWGGGGEATRREP